MTGLELAQRMSVTKVTLDELAESLNRHRDEVSSWLASERSLPRGLVRELEWHLAVRVRDEQMRASGLPSCPWQEAHSDVPQGDTKALEQYIAEIDAHAKTCPICERRAAYAATLPPLPPVPMGPYLRFLGNVALAVGRLPQWARPAAVGGLLIGGWTLVRAIILVAVRRAPVTPKLLLTVLAALGLGIYGGLVGGIAYALIRPPSRRLGRAGDYVTGIVCVYAYLAAFGIPAALFTSEEMFRSTTGWVILLIVGAVFGVVVGHSWFRTSASDGGA